MKTLYTTGAGSYPWC